MRKAYKALCCVLTVTVLCSYSVILDYETGIT